MPIMSLWYVLFVVSTTMSQQISPFSEEELYQALRLILPETEARAAAAPLPAPTAEHFAELQPGEHIVRGINFTDDTLILLSLVSEELRVRVERYRARRRGAAPLDADDERAWQARCNEISKLVTPEHPA